MDPNPSKRVSKSKVLRNVTFCGIKMDCTHYKITILSLSYLLTTVLKATLVRYSSHTTIFSSAHNVYDNNYNKNYSFVIFICLQTFFKLHLFFILLTRLRSQPFSLDLHIGDRQTRNITQDWYNYYCLLCLGFLFTQTFSL